MPLPSLITLALSVVVVIVSLCFVASSSSAAAADVRLPPRLPARAIKRLVGQTDLEALWRDLERIAIVRPPDSPGNQAVREYILSQFDAEKLTQRWDVEIDEFTSDTPYSVKTFRNIIATWNCNAPERIVLAAHYDSKYFAPPRHFVGATDSAAPCAMLLDIVRTLDRHLTCPSPTNLGLQVVFFDGEEAFKHWTPTDSIYGARHLAQKWADEGKLSSISVLVLLDLIGVANVKFSSFWASTDPYYSRLRAIETSLKNTLNGTGNYFQSKFLSSSSVQDDHVPFLQRQVKILHLIANPFPSVWHTDSDNLNAIHLPTLADVAAIMRVFVAELMGVGNQDTSRRNQHESAASVMTGQEKVIL